MKLFKPTQTKKDMYQTMADRTTAFANRYISLGKAKRPKTSGETKEYFAELPSAVLCQAIRDICSKKKAKHFDRLWPSFNNLNPKFRILKKGEYLTRLTNAWQWPNLPVGAGRTPS